MSSRGQNSLGFFTLHLQVLFSRGQSLGSTDFISTLESLYPRYTSVNEHSTEYTVLTHIGVWVKTKINILYPRCKFNIYYKWGYPEDSYPCSGVGVSDKTQGIFEKITVYLLAWLWKALQLQRLSESNRKEKTLLNLLKETIYYTKKEFYKVLINTVDVCLFLNL